MGEFKRGLLIVISGPSAVGKGTVCKEYVQKHTNARISVSSTTRQPREGEVDGINYFFVTKDTFQKGIQNNLYLEYAQVHGNYYGTPIEEVNKHLATGKDVILEIDVQGALQVKKLFESGVYIFIMPPSIAELKNRIQARGTETQEQIEKRLSIAEKEIEVADQYGYIIVNEVVSDTVNQLSIIIENERESQR
jgi:guanylate kinase